MKLQDNTIEYKTAFIDRCLRMYKLLEVNPRTKTIVVSGFGLSKSEVENLYTTYRDRVNLLVT